VTLLLLDQIGEIVEPWAPTVDDVAALLHARTQSGAAHEGVALGDELGTFNADTRPTATEVRYLIAFAVSDVKSRVGTDISETWWDEARRLTSLQAAALVEASYFPGEIDTDRSAYRQFTAMYLSGIDALAGDARRPAALRLV
jgi:hypothetical protein